MQREKLMNYTAFKTGDRVCLGGDMRFVGRLVNPISNSYPQRWTVEFEDGKYESIAERGLMLLESREEPEPKQESEVEKLQKRIKELEQQLDKVNEENSYQRRVIRRAKNISPIERPSFQRVAQLAFEACLEVKRVARGWIVSLGQKMRKFRTLTDIFEFLIRDDWAISDLFPEDEKVNALDLLPPLPKKPPRQGASPTFPLMTPWEVRFKRHMPKVILEENSA